jgi:hypothetical protein
MTTPKELADKAKQQAEACQEAWTPYDINRADKELHATIDQLQAMAEARQGSGEPVATPWHQMSQHRRDFIARGESFVRSLYNDPKDDIRVVEVGAWIQYANQLLQRLPDSPSAQQATGSGQVLTDGFSYAASKQLATVTKDWCRGWDACRAALAAATQAHPDDTAVDAFAQAMKDKLAAARAKGRDGWQGCSPDDLSRMLLEHVEKGDPRDVANFCMFLWHMGAAVAAPTTGKREPLTPAERRRLWNNSPEHHADAKSITGFERIVTLTERVHGITGD